MMAKSKREWVGQPLDNYWKFHREKMKQGLETYEKSLIFIVFYMLNFSSPTAGLYLMPCLISALNAFTKCAVPFIVAKSLLPNKRMIEFYLQNSLEGIKLEVEYIKFLKDLASFCIKMGWDNEMKVFSGITYMLENGYLSYSRRFVVTSNIDVLNENCILRGAAVISGTGECRHLNTFLFELLALLGYQVRPCTMRLEDAPSQLKTQELIRLEEEEGHVENTKGSNHLVVMFQDKRHSYFLDLMHYSIYWVDQDYHVLNGKDTFNVKYDRNFNDLKLVSGRALKIIPTSETILDERLRDYYTVQDACIDLDGEFQTFYETHASTYENITKLRKKIHSHLRIT